MRKLLLLFVLAPLLLAAVSPAGQVDISVSGYTATLTLHDMQGVNQNWEVTVGTRCVDAAGEPLVMWDTSGNNAGHNPYILEVTWFGHYDRVGSATVPSTAVSCQSQMIAAKWFKGEACCVAILDPWETYPVPQ